MHLSFAGVLLASALALAACSTQPQDPAKVAQAAAKDKDCVPITGSNLCRKPGSSNAVSVSPETIQNGSRTFKGTATN